MIFCGCLGPHNYVSMRELVIAPKLCGAHFEGTKLHGAQIWGSKTPRGEFSLIFAPCSFGPIDLGPTEFWSPQSAPT